MRTFYIFKINKEMTILTKDIPYNLYRTIEQIYYMEESSINVSYKLFSDLFTKLDKEYIDNYLYKLFSNNRYYTYKDGIHIYNNKYLKENSRLKVFNSHIVLKSNYIKPSLLINYLHTDNLFVVDFKYKDYFWLNELVR